MPAFLFTAKDVPNSAELRTKYLIEHLTFAQNSYANILVGGPCFQIETPKVMDRSLVLLDAPDADTARSMFESDPYFKNKIWESYEMMAFTPVIGTYLGGKSWDLVDGKVVRKELPQK